MFSTPLLRFVLAVPPVCLPLHTRAFFPTYTVSFPQHASGEKETWAVVESATQKDGAISGLAAAGAPQLMSLPPPPPPPLLLLLLLLLMMILL